MAERKPKKSAAAASPAASVNGARASSRTAARPARSATRTAPRAPRRAPPAQAAGDGGTTKRIMRIRALDPQATCGRGTTVMQLYRVDDLPTDGVTSSHLVFFDRHGWYCEHGRDCPAVAAVRKHEKHNILTR